MPWLLSTVVFTAPGLVSQKLGQPVPLSNLCLGVEQFGAAAGALELAGALFMVQGAGARALGAVLAHHMMLFGGELALGLGVCHGVFLSIPNTLKPAKSYGFDAITMASISLSRPVLPKAKPAS